MCDDTPKCECAPPPPSTGNLSHDSKKRAEVGVIQQMLKERQSVAEVMKNIESSIKTIEKQIHDSAINRWANPFGNIQNHPVKTAASGFTWIMSETHNK